jgi:hypothetical protein
MVSWLLQLVYYGFRLLILPVCFNPHNRTAPCQLQSIGFANNQIPNEHDKVYECLARLPLAYPAITSINRGCVVVLHSCIYAHTISHVCVYLLLATSRVAVNEIASGLVESLCNVNKDHVNHLIHGLCEKVALL